MPTPGFPPNTLDADGTPIWLSELASADANHTLHVIRDIEPAAALAALGVRPDQCRPCALPDTRPDDWTSLPSTALGLEPGSAATLLAGRVGAWTFVYDDSGATSYDDTLALSADGRVAATSTCSVNADAGITYAVDGCPVAWIDLDDLDLDGDLPGLPPELRAAFDAAGIVELDYLDPGEPDYGIGMRTVCALAGLAFAPGEVRGLPLLVAPLG